MMHFHSWVIKAKGWKEALLGLDTNVTAAREK